MEAVAPSDTEVGEVGVGDSGVSSPSFTASMIDGDSGGDDAVLSPDTNVLSGSLGSGSDQDLDSDPFQAIGRDGTSADEGGRASSFLDVDGLVEVDSDFDRCALRVWVQVKGRRYLCATRVIVRVFRGRGYYLVCTFACCVGMRYSADGSPNHRLISVISASSVASGVSLGGNPARLRTVYNGMRRMYHSRKGMRENSLSNMQLEYVRRTLASLC